MRFALVLGLAFCILLLPSRASSQTSTNPQVAAAAEQNSPSATASVPSTQASPSAEYNLTPEQRAKAISYSTHRYVLHFVETFFLIVLCFILFRTKVAVVFRRWANRGSKHLFVQCLILAPLFMLLISLIEFPLDYYSEYSLEHRFGISTQSLASWLGDWGKGLALSLIMSIFLVWIFYAVARRRPRRWWFYFWVISIPIALFIILIQPYVVESLFFKFTPLQQTRPELTNRIEQMLHRAGLSIPPSRIFEMNASSKMTAVDAYVSGLGSSKRVVIFDTTVKKLNSDEVLVVLGHETGHYVLHHIPKEFTLIELSLLLLFCLGYKILTWAVERLGPARDVHGVGDLASLPLALGFLTILMFFWSPIFNGISRHYEHQADQYGLELTHGVVPDPNASCVHAFQVLGETNLADPDPGAFIKFWLYSHPPLTERIQFAATYHPWKEGKPMELLKSSRE
jgi:Zn-dependent protease with chaperone function